MKKTEQKKHGKRIAVILSSTIAGLFLLIWMLGWFAPIGVLTPMFLMLSRPEISSVSKNLMIGNGTQYFSSPWFMNVTQPAWNAKQMVYGMTALCDQAKNGETVYYSVYSEEERKADREKKNVGLYALHADNDEKRPYVIMIAGGGYSSVCTPMESLPVCAAFQEMGYTCFALTYRVGKVFGVKESEEKILEDVSAAVSYLTDHAEELNIEAENYLIGGFSAGADVASTWCNDSTGYASYDLPAPSALCLMYGMNTTYKANMSVPTFIRFCKDDPYFLEEDFLTYTNHLSSLGIDYDYKKVNCLHGFGLGLDTEAEGWTKEAEVFWKSQR